MGWKEALAALTPVVLAGAWWLYRRAKRKAWEADAREAAERRAAAAKTPSPYDDEAEAIIFERLKEEAEDDEEQG